MALAPQVYEFNRNLGRSGGPSISPVRRAVDVVGKAALAAGALAGAAYLGSQYLNKSGESFGKLELDDEPDVPAGYPSAGGASSSVVQASGDVTPPPTSDRFNQDLIVNQTSEVQQAKGLSPVKPTTNVIEQKPATQSEVISSQQHFSPGTEEEMLGQGAAERAAAFRKSKAYAVMQQQYPGLREIESPTQPASPAPVVLKDVNVGESLRTSIPTSVKSEVKIESPVAAMAQPAQAPVTASVGVSGGASMREIRELDATLARSMARHTPEQRVAVRNQLLAKKYPSASQEAPEVVVTPTQPTPVRVAVETAPKTARVRANEFLSQMSQEQGPLVTYAIDPSRSKAVSGIAFYPGGEVGVSLPTKTNPAKEYVYGASDPLRLALSDYAEEGFPGGMGHVGKILGYQGIAPGMGMLQRLTPGGQSSGESAPLYTGLMSEKEINTVLSNPKSPKSKMQRAGYDEETRGVMAALEARAAARAASARGV
jgi:hypothetical protein